MTTPDDIHEFWYGPPGSAPLANSASWYKKDAAFDLEIKTRFEGDLQRAARGELDEWKTTPRGRIALVILLDQFSRNIYRGDARSFAQDRRACETSLEGIANGSESALEVVERNFLYMPLMHAEDVDLQHKCIAAFERLQKVAPEALSKFVDSGLDYAKRHAEIIERFGRFPHRNALLDRSSTPEEIEFLKQPGSSF